MKVSPSIDELLPRQATIRSAVRSTVLQIRGRDALPLREAIPLWFALSSPLIGLILGFLGAWFVSWLTS
ncbi:MAG TPA: hypothetical protein VFA51_01590 [Candidatus Udaeobacter sp.]|nr:hypothetical protein [Candidatus Udaeobacter sp.]